MSFSLNVKNELYEEVSNARHCKIAELSGILLMNQKYLSKDFLEQKIENELLFDKYNKLLKQLNLDSNDIMEIKLTAKIIEKDQNISIDPIVIQRSCCKKAFLRGVFLSTGSVTNPEKSYHFEIVFLTQAHLNIVISILKDFNIEAKEIRRKKYFVIYVKDGTMIVDILNIIGAHISLMNMENVRILKDMRNSVNRRVNCETANISKTVNAAVKQIEDIIYIEKTKGLNYLPDSLKKIAIIRMENDLEIPLKELGEMLNPCLSKSGVNHRLRKISEIAKEIRRMNNYDNEESKG